jgi:hypothetical protein
MPTQRTISELLFQYLTKVSNPLVLLQGAHGYNVLAASRHLKQKRALKKQASCVAAYGNFIVGRGPWPFCLDLEVPRVQKKAYWMYRKLLLLVQE